MKTSPPVEHLNPEGLHHNAAFTNVVVVREPARTLYVGGQNALTPDGSVVGPGNLAAQTKQVFANIRLALAAAGAELSHVVKWNVYVAPNQPLEDGFEVFQREWGQSNPPPAITVTVVAALANPEFLIEMDAIAVVPAPAPA